MTPTFTLCHATYGRPEKAVAAMRDVFAKAACPGKVEYIFAVNVDDEPTLDAIRYLRENTTHPTFTFAVGDFPGSAPAWDSAAKVSTGEVLVQMQDDLVLPQDWELLLEERLMATFTGTVRWEETPIVVAVSDGYRKDALLCTAIINRARYDQVGEFLHADYRSVFSDDDFTVRAMRDADRNDCTLIDARDIVFKHENPYHTGAHHDATLLRENSPEAYRVGAELFAKRNPWAGKYRTWG